MVILCKGNKESSVSEEPQGSGGAAGGKQAVEDYLLGAGDEYARQQVPAFRRHRDEVGDGVMDVENSLPIDGEISSSSAHESRPIKNRRAPSLPRCKISSFFSFLFLKESRRQIRNTWFAVSEWKSEKAYADRLPEVPRIGWVLKGVSSDEHHVQGHAARPDICDLSNPEMGIERIQDLACRRNSDRL